MYALEVIICSGLLYTFYRLLLEGRVAHRTARVYLVLSLLLSVAVPLLELPILPPQEDRFIELEMVNSEVVATTITAMRTFNLSIRSESINISRLSSLVFRLSSLVFLLSLPRF